MGLDFTFRSYDVSVFQAATLAHSTIRPPGIAATQPRYVLLAPRLAPAVFVVSVLASTGFSGSATLQRKPRSLGCQKPPPQKRTCSIAAISLRNNRNSVPLAAMAGELNSAL
jgi:hypothetical protein